MSDIKENYDKIYQQVKDAAVSCSRKPEDVKLIAVSKRKSVELMLNALDAGAKEFGENYIQEAVEKIERIGKDKACWHFIGHLQSNKAKLAVNYFDYIHTVDTVKLAKQINNQANNINKIQKILVQVNIGDEKTKSGSNIEQVLEVIKQISTFDNISIRGLMCMPPYSSEPEEARGYFKKLVSIKEGILTLGIENISMEHLSMGMSNDFKVAIEEGSTMVRVGTSIFGKRD
jgi:pyridoxal phosphate enzyme (YggS family)